MRFPKRNWQFLFLSFLCCCKWNRKKKKWKKTKKTYNNWFLGGYPKMRRWKKVDFWQKLPDTIFASGREKNAHFRAQYLFWPQTVFCAKSMKTRKNHETSGFSGNWPKPKKTPFVWKRCFFSMGEKVFFTNCVFAKLCSSANTIFIAFSAKSSSCSKNMYVEKQKIYEK